MLNYSSPDVPVIRHRSKEAANTFNRNTKRNTNRNGKNNQFSNQNDATVVPEKSFPKNVRHGAVTPRDVPRCQICCVLELFFVHSNFPFLLLPSSLSSPTSSLSPFSPPLLFPKRWTRNLAIADRIRSAWWKHPQGNTDIEHILYLSVRPV